MSLTPTTLLDLVRKVVYVPNKGFAATFLGTTSLKHLDSHGSIYVDALESLIAGNIHEIAQFDFHKQEFVAPDNKIVVLARAQYKKVEGCVSVIRDNSDLIGMLQRQGVPQAESRILQGLLDGHSIDDIITSLISETPDHNALTAAQIGMIEEVSSTMGITCTSEDLDALSQQSEFDEYTFHSYLLGYFYDKACAMRKTISSIPEMATTVVNNTIDHVSTRAGAKAVDGAVAALENKAINCVNRVKGAASNGVELVTSTVGDINSRAVSVAVDSSHKVYDFASEWGPLLGGVVAAGILKKIMNSFYQSIPLPEIQKQLEAHRGKNPISGLLQVLVGLLSGAQCLQMLGLSCSAFENFDASYWIPKFNSFDRIFDDGEHCSQMIARENALSQNRNLSQEERSEHITRAADWMRIKSLYDLGKGCSLSESCEFIYKYCTLVYPKTTMVVAGFLLGSFACYLHDKRASIFDFVYNGLDRSYNYITDMARSAVDRIKDYHRDRSLKGRYTVDDLNEHLAQTDNLYLPHTVMMMRATSLKIDRLQSEIEELMDEDSGCKYYRQLLEMLEDINPGNGRRRYFAPDLNTPVVEGGKKRRAAMTAGGRAQQNKSVRDRGDDDNYQRRNRMTEEDYRNLEEEIVRLRERIELHRSDKEHYEDYLEDFIAMGSKSDKTLNSGFRHAYPEWELEDENYADAYNAYIDEVYNSYSNRVDQINSDIQNAQRRIDEDYEKIRANLQRIRSARRIRREGNSRHTRETIVQKDDRIDELLKLVTVLSHKIEDLERKQLEAPRDKAPVCGVCGNKHYSGKCNHCGIRHCKDASCPNAKKEAPAGSPHITQSHLSSVFILRNDDGNSTCFKGKVPGKGTYLIVNHHQLIDGTNLMVCDDKEYALPPKSASAWSRLFSNRDIAALDWSWFKGNCPRRVSSLNLLVDTKPNGNFTFVSIDPNSQKLVTCGISGPNITRGEIQYNVDTQSGSCGSPVFVSSNNLVTVCGIHNNTVGQGNFPNRALRFISEKASSPSRD